MYILKKDTLGYYRCDPIPTEDELEQLYCREFYTSAKPDYIKSQEEDIRWWNLMYDDRLAVMGEVYKKSSRKLFPLMLDLGCGGGFFLRRAFINTHLQWMGVGVEPNDVAREYAQNQDNHSIFYEKSLDAVKETRFWGVHLSEVLEHVRNPLQMLKDAYDKLLIGGVICVVVPNEKFYWSTDAVDYKLKYPHVFMPPQHINYFTFESLEALMIMVGFEIYERSVMFPMELFLAQGMDYTESPAVGKVCHQMRKNFDLAMTSEERRTFYRNLASEGLGRECVVYGVKK